MKLPAKLAQRWKEREVTLKFCISAPNRQVFEERYFSFANFLKDGQDGWLLFSLPELSRTFRMRLVRQQAYKQLTYFDNEVMATFEVVFEEPEPNF